MTTSTIETIVTDLQMIAQVAAMFPPATLPATFAASILKVIQSGVAAHVAITGQPFDASLLAPVTPA